MFSRAVSSTTDFDTFREVESCIAFPSPQGHGGDPELISNLNIRNKRIAATRWLRWPGCRRGPPQVPQAGQREFKIFNYLLLVGLPSFAHCRVLRPTCDISWTCMLLNLVILGKNNKTVRIAEFEPFSSLKNYVVLVYYLKKAIAKSNQQDNVNHNVPKKNAIVTTGRHWPDPQPRPMPAVPIVNPPRYPSSPIGLP